MDKFFNNYSAIKNWLIKNDIQNHIINDDLTVDVRGSVFLDRKNLLFLPIQFGLVDGNFYCQNNQLTTLLGAPFKVNGMFQCSDNKLTSLEFSPEVVGGDFRCSNNPLPNLAIFKSIIYGSFECENCPIHSLIQCHAKINKNFIHSWLVNDLENAPKLYDELIHFYKKDLFGKKIKTELNHEEFNTILEKLKLESSTQQSNHTKKSVRI